MIVIKNTQRKIKLDIIETQLFIQKVLDILNYSDYDIGFLFVSLKTIQDYNREYRHKDKPTDVISFPFYTNLKTGQKIKPESDEEKNLGDIIICPEYLNQESQKLQVSFKERLEVIIVHSMCHLLGYDHITDSDYKRMRAKEAFILKKSRE